MRKLKYFSLLLIVAILVLCSTLSTNKMVVNAVETNTISTSAKAMCVLEKDSGRVVASKNMNTQLAMASTTKIVTALTVIQNCDNLDAIIQVDDSAIGVEGSSIYLRKGELISVKDLLYGLMLRSGNDSAVALACHTGGSVEDFAKMMNETAKKAGANNSNFVISFSSSMDYYSILFLYSTVLV